MHIKPILSICLLYDMKTLVSAGKDRKIKVWNIANYQNICTMQDHTENINTLIVSYDQKYLFSGGDDYKVIVYYVQNW